MQICFSDYKTTKRLPEANIQAEFYHLCRNAGIQILLEIYYKNCRFDAVIFHNNKPVLIIEVKNYGRKRLLNDPENGCFFHGEKRQHRKYEQVGLQIFVIPSKGHILPVFDKVCEFLNNL